MMKGLPENYTVKERKEGRFKEGHLKKFLLMTVKH